MARGSQRGALQRSQADGRGRDGALLAYAVLPLALVGFAVVSSRADEPPASPEPVPVSQPVALPSTPQDAAADDEVQPGQVLAPTSVNRPALVHVPAGVFYMGSESGEPGRYAWEGPVHRVHISALEVCATEVTQAQF